jgi:MoxR-like ATPase
VYEDLISEVTGVSNLLKDAFVEKDDIVDLLMVCAVAHEHLLIVGPPGTAKSGIAQRFARLCSPEESATKGDIPYFEYLLTRFTEPNEIFGPVDIESFKTERVHRRVTDSLLPRAEIAFLDEVFKANSAILNALLNLLNERVFYNAGRPDRCPLICAVGATNDVPDNPDLGALYDRFLVRVWTDNVEEARFPALFDKGWELVQERIRKPEGSGIRNTTKTETFRSLHRSLDRVDLTAVSKPYREVVRQIRAEGIDLSDRRVVSLLKLIAASARLDGREEATPADFWVLAHIWNSPEQVPHLRNILEPYLAEFGTVPWASQRAVDLIEADVESLDADFRRIAEASDPKHRTDPVFSRLLADANDLLQEARRHGDETAMAPILERVNGLVDSILNLMEEDADV